MHTYIHAMEIASCYLEGNADAVEFCPHDPFLHIFAAATYTLHEKGESESHRAGTISLFSCSPLSTDSGDDASDTGLQLLHREETPGIFDIKWSPAGEGSGSACQPLLALADADGFLSIRELQADVANGNKGISLKEICNEKVSSSMCLYVDWRQSGDSLSVSLSDGSVSLISFTESELKVSQSWVAHKFEAWTTNFDIFNPHLLYSGSDDCCFCCWDTRQNPSLPVFRNSKSHTMGVCCISQSTSNPNMLLTGSYDESLRVWDIRSSSKPLTEKSICLGGGVWRIKPHPYISDIVIAACMHNGFSVVKVGGEREEVLVLERYEKHGSLAYGVDWMKGENARNDSIVASCSFYDRLLRVWKPQCLGKS
ncbi:Transducin/WD40 repeat-like superfamily protein [Rhynchospora pubera]|uniref:methylated diphthine methylhydrolase n=1 Tax=Rhynchospora pubera TaxID=906938 RepID=A0AAV8EMW6_9POAL|nr:Transducin/WD40 repeat-like superfamily protein [Rhynchospora pubera]